MVKSPVVDDWAWNVVPASRLVAVTSAPAIDALLLSITTPVSVPRFV